MAISRKSKSARASLGVEQKRMHEVFSASSLPQPNDAVGFLLWRALLVYQGRVERSLGRIGLTHLQFAVLATAGWLSLSETEVRQRDIVTQSGIKEAQVSLMIKALRMKGLLIQESGVRDPRVRAIRLTVDGALALESALPLINEVQQALWPTAELQGEMSTMLVATLHRWESQTGAHDK